MIDKCGLYELLDIQENHNWITYDELVSNLICVTNETYEEFNKIYQNNFNNNIHTGVIFNHKYLKRVPKKYKFQKLKTTLKEYNLKRYQRELELNCGEAKEYLLEKINDPRIKHIENLISAKRLMKRAFNIELEKSDDFGKFNFATVYENGSLNRYKCYKLIEKNQADQNLFVPILDQEITFLRLIPNYNKTVIIGNWSWDYLFKKIKEKHSEDLLKVFLRKVNHTGDINKFEELEELLKNE